MDNYNQWINQISIFDILLTVTLGEINSRCHIISYHIISYHVMSCHVMSCHVMSCHVMSYHISCLYDYTVNLFFNPYPAGTKSD